MPRHRAQPQRTAVALRAPSGEDSGDDGDAGRSAGERGLRSIPGSGGRVRNRKDRRRAAGGAGVRDRQLARRSRAGGGGSAGTGERGTVLEEDAEETPEQRHLHRSAGRIATIFTSLTA
jgi:hypothetical protein